MGKKLNISLVALGLILLSGCTSLILKSPDKACGPYPGPDENSENVELIGMGQESQFHRDLAKQPFTYIQCRAAHGDQDAFYVMGIMVLNGIQVPQDYKWATTLFSEATYRRAGRGQNIILSGGQYAGIVNFETTPEKQGIPDAYYQLALMYQKGLIKGADPEQWEGLFEKAAAMGHAKAAEALAEMTSQESGEN